MGNTQVCSGCGAALDAQQGQQFQQQGQQFTQQGQQFPQQGQQFPQQGQQFPQQGQQFPQQGQQFQQQGQQFPQQGQQFPQQGQQFPQQGQQFQQQGQQFPQQGMQGPPPGAPLKKGLSKKLMIIIGASALVVIGVVLVLIFAIGGSSNESEEFFDDGGDVDNNDNVDIGDVDNGDEPTANYPDGWPVDILPPGFPVYPEGDFEDGSTDIVIIFIHNTSINTFEEYKKELEAWGFEFEEMDLSNLYYGVMSDWRIAYSFSESENTACISLAPNDADTGDDPSINYTEGWPTDELPSGFPEYPGGKPAHALSSEYLHIKINDTDENNFEGYIADLKAWGFDFNQQEPDGSYKGYAEQWFIIIHFNDRLDTTFIVMSENNHTLGGTEGWPTDELPSGFPEYPGGKPKHNIDGPYVFITIEDTDKKTFEGYMADLKAWGFEFGEPDSDGVYMGFAENLQLIIVFAEDINFVNIGLGPPAD